MRTLYVQPIIGKLGCCTMTAEHDDEGTHVPPTLIELGFEIEKFSSELTSGRVLEW